MIQLSMWIQKQFLVWLGAFNQTLGLRGQRHGSVLEWWWWTVAAEGGVDGLACRASAPRAKQLLPRVMVSQRQAAALPATGATHGDGQGLEAGDEPVLVLPLQQLLQVVHLVLCRRRWRRLLRARLHGDHREAVTPARGDAALVPSIGSVPPNRGSQRGHKGRREVEAAMVQCGVVDKLEMGGGD
jgi:hypothetical protein